jgi:hypothetical protein
MQRLFGRCDNFGNNILDSDSGRLGLQFSYSHRGFSPVLRPAFNTQNRFNGFSDFVGVIDVSHGAVA